MICIKKQVILICVMKASSLPSSLEYLYLGDDSPYALSGNTQSLLEAGRSLGIPQPTTLRYLQGEPTYTLHRPRRVRFPRSKTVVDPNLDSTGKRIWWKCKIGN